MATSGNSRDVKMTLSVDTLGEDGVKSLQQSIQTLANQGGTAAPKFQELADQVGRLGEQSKSLTTFRELTDTTAALSAQQVTASQSTAALATKLDSLRTASETLRANQQSATQALVAGQTAVIDAGTAIKVLKTEYTNAEKQTTAYRTELARLLTAQGDAKTQLVALRLEQQNANKELAAAEAGQTKMETAYGRSAKAADAAAQALSKQEAVLREAAAATEKLGLSTTDVAASEGKLLVALNALGAGAAKANADILDMAESDQLLAIQERGLADLYQRGANALQAETLAQRDAARSNAEYDASLAKVNAEKAKATNSAAQWQREAEAIVNASLSAQKLERDTLKLVETERELKAVNAFEKQYQDAQRMVQAADYVRFWTAELDKADAAAKQMQGAFNTLNIRSAEAIKADILAVRTALETVKSQAATTGSSMAGAFTAGETKIKALELELRQLNGTLTTGDKAAKIFASSMGQISAGQIVADAVGYLVNKVKELGVAFLTTIVQGDQMRRGLMAIYKDAGVTASQIDFLKKSSSESGVAFSSLTGEFVKFSASMKMANIPMAQSNDLFRAVTAASASLGLGAEATAGTLNALGQMASKGCHAPGTMIRLLDGTERLVEHITLGDVLMGPDGTGRTVQELAHGTEAMYRITPSSGKPFVVNRSHKLRVFRGAAVETLMLRDFLLLPARAQGKCSLVLSGQHIGFSVSSEGEGEYFGFTLSGDHLYLDAQGFEHHNTVSMEELRQQLGDRLPGAMGLTAKGFGITEAQLISLITAGGLATRDFIVPFTKALGELQGETDGLVPSWERFKGVLAGMAQGMGAAGGVDLLTGSLKTLGGFVGTVTLGLSTLIEYVLSYAKTLGTLAAAAVTLTNPLEQLKEIWTSSADRLVKQNEALNVFIDGTDSATTAATTHTAAMTANTAELTKQISSNQALTSEQKLAALSTALAKDATLDASAKIVQYNVAATALIKTQQAATISYAALAKAAKEEGDTTLALAKMTGDETLIRQASIAASNLHAAALEKVSASHAAELAMLVAQKAELLASAAARGLTETAIKTQVDALDALINASKAETEQAKQATLAASADAFNRKLTIETLKDHSKQIIEFQNAVESTAKTVAEYERLALQGKKTEQEVTEAKREHTRAVALHNDALADSVRMISAESAVKQANYNVTLATLDVQAKAYTHLSAAARASGDLATATYYEIEAKRVQIAITRLTAEAKMKEAEASIAGANAEMEALKATGKLTEEKKLEIEARLLNAKVKQIEAGASAIIIQGLEAEITSIRNGVDARSASTSAINADTGARQANIGVVNGQTDAINNQSSALRILQALREKTSAPVSNREKIDAENPYGKTSDGLTANKDGSAKGTFNNTLPIDQAYRIKNAVDTGQTLNMTQAELDTAKTQAKNALTFLQEMSRLSAGSVSVQAMQDAQALVNAANTGRVNVTDKPTSATTATKATTPTTTTAQKTDADIAKAMMEAAGLTYSGESLTDAKAAVSSKTKADTSANNSSLGYTPSPATTVGANPTTRTINIVINGSTTAVNVASAADATALESILRSLSTSASTAA